MSRKKYKEQSITSVKSCQEAVKAYKNRYNSAKENLEFFKINMKAVYTTQLASPILEIVGASSLAIVIFLGAKEVYAQRMSVGEFMAFLTAVAYNVL